MSPEKPLRPDPTSFLPPPSFPAPMTLASVHFGGLRTWARFFCVLFFFGGGGGPCRHQLGGGFRSSNHFPGGGGLI